MSILRGLSDEESGVTIAFASEAERGFAVLVVELLPRYDESSGRGGSERGWCRRCWGCEIECVWGFEVTIVVDDVGVVEG